LIRLIILFCSFLFSENIIISDEKTSLTFNSVNNYQENIKVIIGEIETSEIIAEQNQYLQIRIPGYHSSKKVGSPQLPQINQLIEIPQSATARIEIQSYKVEEYLISDLGKSNYIFPSQPSVSKSQSPQDIEFKFDKNLYKVDEFINRDLIEVKIKGQMRGVRVANLIIKPVNYNPVTGVVKIYSEIDFQIFFDGANINLTQEIKKKYYCPYFLSTYNQISNFSDSNNRESISNHNVTYLIISNPVFINYLDDFISWKKQKGFNVLLANTLDIGSSTENIKSHVEDLYFNPPNNLSPPSFVLFVGDVAQVPTFNGTTGSHPTDLYYTEMTNDMIPDIYRGRFSAENPNQLEAQLNKTIEYEKYMMPDPSYLQNVLLVSGVDSYYAATHGNGQINYGNEYYFNSTNDINSYTYLYPESDEANAASLIIQDYNQGVGFANYTAHCSTNGWADPSFSVTDVANMTNLNQYNLMIGNCCTSTAFDQELSFGEAVLRVANKGAIGYVGGTNNTYWNEDFWWGVGSGNISANPTYENSGVGVYDGLFHKNGEPEEQWFIVNDAINMAGNLAVSEEDGNLESYYWEIYHVMGDPSIMTYLGIPSINNVTHPPIIQLGSNQINITSDPYSHVALYMNGELYGSAFTGSYNNVVMDIYPITEPGTAYITVTAQNKEPYIGTIDIGNANGPYPIIEEYSITSSDNDDIIENGEEVTISLTLKNLGNELLNNYDILISSDDNQLNIINGESNNLEDLLPENTLNISNLSFSVQENIANNHPLNILVTINNNQNSWEYTISLTAFAPEITLSQTIINSGNGQINPGDTVEMGVVLSNNGGASIENLILSLSTEDEFTTINLSTHIIERLDPNSSEFASFSITINEFSQLEHIIPFNLDVTNTDYYNENFSFYIPIGVTVEDFETNNFDSNNWEFSGNSNWVISSESYEGNHSASSGSIANNQITELIFSTYVALDDSISFHYKVSSEINYDYLKFYINNNEINSWSGEISWEKFIYPVNVGENIFRWVYTKDGSVNSGQDKAWIDLITFPPLGPPSSPNIVINIEELIITMNQNETMSDEFTIFNTGTDNLQYTIETAISSNEMNALTNNLYSKLRKGEIDTRNGIESNRDLGGPDLYGYSWIDSNELNGPAYNWFEISNIGSTTSYGDDLSEGPINIGFDFNFYGNYYNTVNICSNGFISFTSTETAYTNQPIPVEGQINNFVAPFWDDLNPSHSGSNGQIYYHIAENRFIVQWQEVEHYGGGNPETFQVILEPSGNIYLNYKIVSDASNNTIGIQNLYSNDGLQIAFNNNYLQSEMTIMLSSQYNSPLITVSPLSGIIGPNNQETISLIFDSNDINLGEYSGNLNIISNDPNQIITDIPILITLEDNIIGDINNDEDLNVIDIVLLVNNILINEYLYNGDINEDNELNIIDIVLLVQIILNQ